MRRNRAASTTLLPLATLALAAVANLARADEKSPNIVVILADDLGYGDVHALNPDSKVPTPNLDSLAAKGMTFVDAHTPSAVCTPTRYGLLTGRYCWRTRLTSGVLDGYGKPLIDRGRPTLASFLAGQGYTCGIVGKWHLGLGFGADEQGAIDYKPPVTHGPNDLGFDFSYIIPASLDFPPYVYLADGRVTLPPTIEQRAQKFPDFVRRGPRSPDLKLEDCLDDLLEQATDFVRRQAAEEKPFFLYFPLTAPHKPVSPHSRFREKTELGPYGDFVTQVDWTVGQALQTLEETGAAENTLVVFTSDNGSFMYRREGDDTRDHATDPTIQAYHESRHTSNHIYRGTKADIWEAGHRVPFFVRWPGRVEGGARSQKTICLTDVFATLGELLSADLPEGAAPDSHSFAATLEGKPAKTRPPVVHHSAAGMFAIRDGDWKLVLGNGSGGREPPRGKPFAKPYQLFNLADDPRERENVIERHPEIAERLESALERIRAEE